MLSFIKTKFNIILSQTKLHASYICIFLLLFFSNDTLLFGTNKNIISQYFSTLVLGLMIIVLALFIFYKKISIDKHLILLFVVLITLICFTMILRWEINEKYAYEIILIVLAFLIISILKDQHYEEKYINTIIFLSVYSLFIFFITRIIRIPSFTIINKSDLVFNNYIFTNILVTPGISPRNYGIFREPGVYQVFLNLAFYFNNRADICKGRLIKNFILIFTIITTFSTAGFLILFALIIFFIYKKMTKRSKIIALIGITLLVFLFSFLYFLFGFKITDISFLNKFTNSNDSYIARLSGFFKNIYITYLYPLFGAGFTFLIKNYESVLSDFFLIPTIDNTNTLLKLYALHGIFYGTIFAIGFYQYCKIYEKKVFFAIILFIILFILCLSNEDLTFNILIYFMFFLGFAREGKYENLSYKYMRQRKHRKDSEGNNISKL